MHVHLNMFRIGIYDIYIYMTVHLNMFRIGIYDIYIYICTVLVPSRHACGITSQETNKIQRMNPEVKRTAWHPSRKTT